MRPEYKKGTYSARHPLSCLQVPFVLVVKRVKGNMAAQALSKCFHPCQRFLTPNDTHEMCVICLGEEHARSVLEGTECEHCESLSM